MMAMAPPIQTNFFQSPQQMLAQYLMTNGAGPQQQSLATPGLGPPASLVPIAQPTIPPQTGAPPVFDPGELGAADRQTALGKSLMEGAGSGPVRTGWEGAGRLAKTLTGAYLQKEGDRAKEAYAKKRDEAVAGALAENDPEKRLQLLGMIPDMQGALVGARLHQAERQSDLKAAAEAPLTRAQQATIDAQTRSDERTRTLAAETQAAAETRLNKQLGAAASEGAKNRQARIDAAKVAVDNNPNNRVDPDAVATTVQALTSYSRDPRSVFTAFQSNKPFGQAVQKGIDIYNKERQAAGLPKFDQRNYQASQRMLNNFTSGNTLESRTIQAGNSASQHLQVLQDLVDASKNGDVQAVNAVSQRIAEEFGSAVPTNLRQAGQIVGTEIMKMLASTGAGGVDERKSLASDFSNIRSPAQLNGAIATASKLMAGQFNTLSKKWGQFFDPEEFDTKFLVPEASDLRNRYGGSRGAPRKEVAMAPTLEEIDAEIARRERASK